VVAVVDLESVWEDVAVEGHEVVVVPPGEEIAERFQGVAPARTIANLAAPGVVDALASLRAAGSTARFWGCLAGPGRDDALALGMVEPAGSPLDPDALVAALGAYAQRGTRVVTAGGDVDVLMSLRQALARRGMSVSMAWDAKQASDLLAVVQPELVVVDLALPRREGYRIVTALTALDPVPHAVVVVPAGEEVAGAFAAVLDEPSPARVAVRRHALLARLVARSEAPPAERNRKLRAIGRK
jgi:CheY-like chemotaxis protein